jgi:hypothetical protein
MHETYPQALGSLTLFDHQSTGDMPNCGSGEYLEKHAATLLAVIKCIYLPPIYLYFMHDIEDMCLLLMSFMSFVDLPFQEHRMMEKYHMD